MEKVLLIFDRLKEAFNINVQNKKIYKSQIMLAIVNAAAIFVLFSILFSYYLRLESREFNFSIFTISDLISVLVSVFLVYILFALILVFFEAGLFHMYYKAVYSGTADNSDFFEGTRKYFWKFFGVNILTTLMWVVIIPVYLILGFISMGAGFVLVPILITIFLSMWKVSLVVNGDGLISAFKSSIKFAGKNFVPFMIFILLMLAFTAPVRQNSGIDYISNIGQKFQQKQKEFKNTPDMQDESIMNLKDNVDLEGLNAKTNLNLEKEMSDIFNENKLQEGVEASDFDLKYPDIGIPSADNELSKFTKLFGDDFSKTISDALSKASGLIKIIILAAISLITLGTFFSLLIKMFFQVFFMLAMFVIYKKGFKKETSESVEVAQA